MRGTIAFALVLKINPDYPNIGVIVTTVLMIVVVTTLVFGSAIPIMSKIFLKDEEKELEEEKV